MKVVYLAGAYRAETESGITANIEAASIIALKIWKLGAACFCPQKNSAHFDGACPDQVFLDGDIEIMLRCDAVFLMDGWGLSAGSTKEREAAMAEVMPIFIDLKDLDEWCNKAVPAV